MTVGYININIWRYSSKLLSHELAMLNLEEDHDLSEIRTRELWISIAVLKPLYHLGSYCRYNTECEIFNFRPGLRITGKII
jgi:hypothetical protein